MTAALLAMIGVVLMIRSAAAGSGEVIPGSVGVVVRWLKRPVGSTLHDAFAFIDDHGTAQRGTGARPVRLRLTARQC